MYWGLLHCPEGGKNWSHSDVADITAMLSPGVSPEILMSFSSSFNEWGSLPPSMLLTGKTKMHARVNIVLSCWSLSVMNDDSNALHNFYKQDSEISSWICPSLHHLPVVAPHSSDALFLQRFALYFPLLGCTLFCFVFLFFFLIFIAGSHDFCTQWNPILRKTNMFSCHTHV